MIGAGFDGHALFRTTNGGASWEGVTEEQGTFVALDFAGGRGWALRLGGETLVSLDGGATWSEGTPLPDPPSTLSALDFWDANVGYAIGGAGYAARSEDGGATWEILPTPNASEVFTDLHLVGPDELWLVAADGTVLHTATAGQSWSEVDAGPAGFGELRLDRRLGNGRRVDRRLARRDPALERPAPAAAQPAAGRRLRSRLARSPVAFTDTSSDPDGTVVALALGLRRRHDVDRAEPDPHLRSGRHLPRAAHGDRRRRRHRRRRRARSPSRPCPGGTFGDFTEVTPLDPLFVTPQDEDFWVATAAPADYDGDGDLDLAVLGFYVVYNESVDYRLVLMRNDGAGGRGHAGTSPTSTCRSAT